MPATFETRTDQCNCGISAGTGVIQDGKAFVLITVHGMTEAEIHRWVADHREALKPLIELSVARSR